MIRQEKHDGFVGQRIVVVPRPIIAAAKQDPLLLQLLPTDCGFYPKAKGHTCSRPQGCAEIICIYCADGCGWCEVAGRRHWVPRNHLLMVPEGSPHSYGANRKAPWTIHWFHAIGRNMQIYQQRLGISRERPVVPLGHSVQLLSLFEEVLQALEHGFTLAHLTYASHSLAHVMGRILRCREEFHNGEATGRERIETSIDFMRGHLREPLRVSTLASLVNTSRSHYTTLFRRITGYAPLNYLTHLRMQRAVQLLSSTSLTIQQISDQVGFTDPFYFSRAFRRMHNHSPSEHRKRHSP